MSFCQLIEGKGRGEKKRKEREGGGREKRNEGLLPLLGWI